MQNSTARNSNYWYQLAIVGLLFFNFGFITWLNGTLIQFLQLTFQLDDTRAFFVTSAFYISYFLLAIPASNILKKTGFKNGTTLGLLILMLGCLLFVPAAQMHSFPLFLIAQFVQGMGLALQQTAVNPFVSIIGPIESGAQRISIMGICNKAAGILSPIVLGSLLGDAMEKAEKATDIAQRMPLLERLVAPYIVLAVIQAFVAFLIHRSSLPNVNMATDDVSESDNSSSITTGRNNIWQFPHLLLGALAIFLYVGIEVMAGDGIGLYGKSLGFEVDQRKYFTSFTLGAMLVGYILSIALIPKYVSQQNFLKYSALLGLVLVTMTYFTSGSTAVMCIALMGLANAVMWPAIFPLAINGLGRFTQIGSALLIMGVAGGAIIPPVYGLLKEAAGFQMAFLIAMLPCYLYILYYATWGYKPR